MTRDIDSVNHVGIAVRDLDAVSRHYERLGFTLTPLSMHRGSLTPGGAEEAFGTGNRCTIFRNNYLEILAWIDRDKFDFGVSRFLEKHEGAHIICFGCGDASTVNARVRSEGFETSGVIPLQRNVGTPEGERTAKFECVHFGDRKAFMPEGLIQAAHHVTPQYIHQDRYMRHANGVVALSEVFLGVADPDAYESKYAKLTGRSAKRIGRKRMFELPLVSRVSILAHADLAAELPGSTFPAAPCMAGYAFATTDLGAVERRLAENALPFHKESARLVLPASAMFGATVVFETA